MKITITLSNDTTDCIREFRFDVTHDNQSGLARIDEAIEFVLMASTLNAIEKKIQVMISEFEGYKYKGSSTIFSLEQNIMHERIVFFTIRKFFNQVCFADCNIYECISKLTELIREDVWNRMKGSDEHEVA